MVCSTNTITSNKKCLSVDCILRTLIVIIQLMSIGSLRLELENVYPGHSTMPLEIQKAYSIDINISCNHSAYFPCLDSRCSKVHLLAYIGVSPQEDHAIPSRDLFHCRSATAKECEILWTQSFMFPLRQAIAMHGRIYGSIETQQRVMIT